MTKIIPIEIEKPRNCPYRVVRYEGDVKSMVCVRENRVCADDDCFPCWCGLIDGRSQR